MPNIIRILHLEDSLVDAELIARMLRKAEPDCIVQHVETQDAFIKGLEEFKPDIILADYQLPDFDGMQALAIAKVEHPEIPFIFVTGKLGEEIAVDTLKKGATDYIIKDRMTRLPASIRQSLDKKDIQEQRLASESALTRSQLILNAALDSMSDAVFISDMDGTFIEFNDAFATFHKFKNKGECAKTLGEYPKFLEVYSSAGELLPLDQWAVPRAMRGEFGVNVEFTLRRKDTNETWVGAYNYGPIRDPHGDIVGTVVTGRDVTVRKQAELELRHNARALATLSAVNRSLVHAVGEDELLHTICQDIVEQSGYKMAWVGYVQHDEAKSIKVMAGSKGSEGYLATKRITWAETELGMGPTGRAVRSGTTELCLDIAHDVQYLPWRSEAMKYGYASSISLPLFEINHVNHGKVLGNLNVYSGVVNAFLAKEIDLLEQMAGDVAFGINALRIRNERNLAVEETKLQLKKLQENLDDTVSAIASIAELRDPYTAGHQMRVARLTNAIAVEMKLSEEQIHALHIAATVHDLGKIMIPAEILSKPGKISNIEYSLIKQHPQAGYDILKGIDFPWPIAQMVLQHHERLDGSGYPQGLKGDAILLEARILAVADVVEAMSSHRPYRAGLGVDAALNEVISKRSTYYDTQVVDACVAVFRDKNFVFYN